MQDAPKDPDDNLLYRAWLLGRCERNGRVRRYCRDRGARDVVWWIDTFCWQYNPKKRFPESKVGPFVLWPFQQEALLDQTPGREGVLWCVRHGKDLLVEKSREMGATWLFLIVMDWLCRYDRHHQSLTMSRSMDAVDNGAPTSLFWKLKFLHAHLPGWLCGRIKKAHSSFSYLDTGSNVAGEASTAKAFVGGRASEAFIDEFSQIDQAHEVYRRTAAVTDCRLMNGTHRGVSTAFYDLSRNALVRKLQMHWTQHPEKRNGLYRYVAAENRIEVLDPGYEYPPDFKFVYSGLPAGGPYPGLRSPWYDEQCVRIGSTRGVAEELDIDPGGSVSQFFDQLVVVNMIAKVARDPAWSGEIKADRDRGTCEGLEANENGPLKLWVNPRPDGSMPDGVYGIGVDIAAGTGATPSCASVLDASTGRKVAEYVNNTIAPHEFAPAVAALARLFRNAKVCYEASGSVGETFARAFLPLYSHVYYRPTAMSYGGSTVPSDKPGFFATPTTSRVLLEEYRAALTMGHFENPSRKALEECLDFEYTATGDVEHAKLRKSADPTARGTNHGDRVVADALAWRVVGRPLGREKPAEEPAVAPGSLQFRRMLAEAGRVPSHLRGLG